VKPSALRAQFEAGPGIMFWSLALHATPQPWGTTAVKTSEKHPFSTPIVDAEGYVAFS
jgi:hypothetical protein